MKKYIVSDPDILGGTPVIKGTRVPIGRILFLLKAGYTLAAIHEDYPHIDITTLSLTFRLYFLEFRKFQLVELLDIMIFPRF